VYRSISSSASSTSFQQLAGRARDRASATLDRLIELNGAMSRPVIGPPPPPVIDTQSSRVRHATGLAFIELEFQVSFNACILHAQLLHVILPENRYNYY